MTKFIFGFFMVCNVLCAQQTAISDFKSVHGTVTVNAPDRSVRGEVEYHYDVLKPGDTIRIDAHNMTFTNVKVDGKAVLFRNSNRQLLIPNTHKKGAHVLSLSYTARPVQTMYFIGAGEDDIQVWTQGQGKYTSHWFPSFDDVNEKLVFNISATFDSAYQVISNGTLAGKSATANNTTWHYKMKQPMSSYLLMLAIGKFDKKELRSASGIPLHLFIEPMDVAKWGPTYRYSKQMFDYLEAEIGVAYPWETYSQIPARDFLYGGMENTTATLFTHDYVVDEIGFHDRNYVNVNAHELAHQWFGDMVTAKSGTHHWLQEGFATYYALLAERDIFGDDYFHWKLYGMAGNLQQAAANDTIPIMNEKASSLTFYQKGAWALHVLRESIGAAKFKAAVMAYLKKHQFGNVETDDFLNEVRKVSNFITEGYKRNWLQAPGFRVQEAIKLLGKNAFMQQYLDVVELANVPFADKKKQFESILKSDVYFPVREEVILQLQQVAFEQKEDLIKLAMQSDDIAVRQAVAKTVIPPTSFVAEFTTLLDDKSYVTQEIALNVLWSHFPDKRSEMLGKMDGRVGLNDKNIRIMWLTMALATKDFQPGNKAAFYDELLQYTTPAFESAVRINAIESLLYIDKSDVNVLGSLVNATVHHKWQLTKFARDKIRELLKRPNHREHFTAMLPGLPQAQQAQLERLLKE